MEHIEFWYWWVAAVVLIILETLVPGTFFLWMGVSASVVARDRQGRMGRRR